VCSGLLGRGCTWRSLSMAEKRTCAYPECETVLNQYNDGDCCSRHDMYDRMKRSGLRFARVPEEQDLSDITKRRKKP
jgi:hypothetical protein